MVNILRLSQLGCILDYNSFSRKNAVVQTSFDHGILPRKNYCNLVCGVEFSCLLVLGGFNIYAKAPGTDVVQGCHGNHRSENICPST